MKKGLWLKIITACSLAFCAIGCTSLDYVGEDITASDGTQTIKYTNITTKEDFTLKAVKKTNGYTDVSVGISQTPLEDTLVLYIGIKNNSQDTRYKFDVSNVEVKSPIGEMSFIQPNRFIGAYETSQANQYTGYLTAGSALGGLASLQNAYNQSNTSSTLVNSANSDNSGVQSEVQQIKTISKGIQEHSITSYKYINPNSSDYFYIFIKTPEEYPITVSYKELTYKFGGR